MSKTSALELAECAKINLQNMVKMMPVLRQHPLLPMVEAQLQECIDELEKDEEAP
jgi:hypothetical protein